MSSRKSSSKRRMSASANSVVSSNNIVECSEDMGDVIKRIMVSEYKISNNNREKCPLFKRKIFKVPLIFNKEIQDFIFQQNIQFQDTPNVMGVMVLNNEGFPIKSNLDNTTTVQYGHMIADLVEKV